MKFGLGVIIAAFIAGLLLAPLGVSGGVLTVIFLLSFLVLIVTYYRSAIRQGHSGLVILPVKRGPMGYDGLKLRLSSVEGTVVAMGIALILGILIGVAVAIGMHEAVSTSQCAALAAPTGVATLAGASSDAYPRLKLA